MVDLRELLNELKWNRDFSNVVVWYVHRGAPHDRKQISGGRILSIDKSSFSTQHSSIPYHRVLLVLYGDEEVFDRTNL